MVQNIWTKKYENEIKIWFKVLKKYRNRKEDILKNIGNQTVDDFHSVNDDRILIF